MQLLGGSQALGDPEYSTHQTKLKMILKLNFKNEIKIDIGDIRSCLEFNYGRFDVLS